ARVHVQGAHPAVSRGEDAGGSTTGTPLAPLAGVLLAVAPAPIRLAPGADLQAAVDAAPTGSRIELAAGVYRLRPVAFEDASCGNCPDPDQRVPATRGLLVEKKSL